MKESVSSLKAFFLFIGTLGVFGSYTAMTQPSGNLNAINLLSLILGTGFSIAYLYMGFSLRKLLVESPQIVTTVILANIAVAVLNFLLSLFQGFQLSVFQGFVLGLLINWYLYSSVLRLSREEKSKPEKI